MDARHQQQQQQPVSPSTTARAVSPPTFSTSAAVDNENKNGDRAPIRSLAPRSRPELCRHWARGRCLAGDRCAFQHPPEHLGLVAPPRRRTWGGTRAVVRNRCKSTVFRRFLIDTFGREALAKGVLDVAGGKGELAFQLVNLNGLPATVVDPRPLHLARFERRAARGAYHRSGPYAEYTDTPLSALRGAGAMRAPGHARAFLDAQLVDALARLAAARQRRRAAPARLVCADDNSGSGSSNGSGSSDSGRAAAPASSEDAEDENACMQAARQALADSLRRAAAVEWTTKGLQEHEQPAEGVSSAAAAALDDEESSSSSSDSDDGGERRSDFRGGSTSSSSSSRGGQETENHARSSRRSADGGARLGAAELDAALEALLNAGCVAAMHPDAATEPAVRLALALGAPFAVVPCCVYQKLFPKRRRAGGGAVGTHAELVAYLVELTESAAAADGLAPRTAHVTELPFEGKNVCVWSAGAAGAAAAAAVVGHDEQAAEVFLV